MIYVRIEKISDEGKSSKKSTVDLDVGCWIEGWLGELPSVGNCVAVVRQVRNGTVSRGLFVSMPVLVVPAPDRFLTVDACYHWRLEVPQLVRHGLN